MHARWAGRTVVVSDSNQPIPGALVVTTPLDMIAHLESKAITTVVLSNTAARRELLTFLVETYPAVRVEEG